MEKSIGYFIQKTIYWLQNYFGEGTGIFLLLTVAALTFLYITYKKLRFKFLWPIIIMMMVILNPVLYKYVFSRIIYWRLFWLVPYSLLIAMAIVILKQKIKHPWLKWGTVLVTIVLIMTLGKNVFEHGGFSERSNWEKLSQETIDVCDMMLALDQTPRAVVHSSINTEVRQYAPEISLMYGREASMPGYIRGAQKAVYPVYLGLKETPPDFEFALKTALEMGFNFFVVSIDMPVDEEWSLEYGYEEIGRTEKHIVYYNDSIED